jgi:uncharacterized protein
MQLIQQHLQRIAAENGFRILYATETGSRGWGFASPDSDFDIRFIFVYPREHYLRISEPQDQWNLIFEDGGEVLDFNAWELRKTLRLLRNSNASPFEWLQSPIQYHEVDDFRRQLWELAQPFHSPRAAVYHYLGICHNSLKTGIEGHQINIKKYFYVLRPLFAAMWAADRQSVPPMQFAPLLEQLNAGHPVRVRVEALWREKEQAKEGQMIDLIPELQTFIETEMERCKALAGTLPKTSADDASLDQFFKMWI